MWGTRAAWGPNSFANDGAVVHVPGGVCRQWRQPAHEAVLQAAQLDEPLEVDCLVGAFEWAAKEENAFRSFRLPHSPHERLILSPGLSRNSVVWSQRAQTYS